MKKTRFLALLICLLATFALAFSGCEADPDADATPDTGTTTNEVTNIEPLDYFWVRVDDLSTDVDDEDPGSDIDAVGLVKGGTYSWLQAGVAGMFASDDRDATVSMDFANAEGAPNAFTGWESGDTTNCSVASAGFASLGGSGGYLIGRFADAIEAGDELVVYEVGNCHGPGTSGTGDYQAAAEPVKLSVSVSNVVDGTWTTVSDNLAGGVSRVTVPALPVVNP